MTIVHCTSDNYLSEYLAVHMVELYDGDFHVHYQFTYQTKLLVGDIVAGINVAIMHIPQGEGRENEREGGREGRDPAVEWLHDLSG